MTPDALLAQLISTLQSQDPSVALAQIEQAATNTQDPRVLLLLASQYATIGKVDSAEAVYISTLQMAPEFSIARFQLGLLQFTSGRPAAAMATWAPIELLPEQHYLRSFVRGFWHLAKDEFAETRQCLLAGVAHNQENLPLNGDMQMLLSRLPDIQATPSYSPPPETETDAEAGQHVLLSSYTKLH